MDDWPDSGRILIKDWTIILKRTWRHGHFTSLNVSPQTKILQYAQYSLFPLGLELYFFFILIGDDHSQVPRGCRA